MELEDLKNKELSNLYAIFKQCNNYFDGSEISFLTEKRQLMLMYYIKYTCGLEEDVSAVLQELGVNPGNTTDSIVEEMTENLKDIIKMDIESDAKQTGYMMSVNRLMSYQIANLENMEFFISDDGVVEKLLSSLEEFRNIQKSIF